MIDSIDDTFDVSGGVTYETNQRFAARGYPSVEQETEHLDDDAEAEQRSDLPLRQAPERTEAAKQGATPGQPLPQPLAQHIDYGDLVRSAFAEVVHPGRLLFNPPDRMQLGQTERVEVRLTRTLNLDTELLQHLRGRGEPHMEQIPTAPKMVVILKGDGFRITDLSEKEQSVTHHEITTWEFDVQALKRGLQRLIICVSLRIPVPGKLLEQEHKSIPVREATIYVQVGTPALVGRFVSSNWQWFVATAIAIAAVVVAALYH